RGTGQMGPVGRYQLGVDEVTVGRLELPVDGARSGLIGRGAEAFDGGGHEESWFVVARGVREAEAWLADRIQGRDRIGRVRETDDERVAECGGSGLVGGSGLADDDRPGIGVVRPGGGHEEGNAAAE